MYKDASKTAREGNAGKVKNSMDGEGDQSRKI